MTLNVGFVSAAFVLQVGDRLLTTSDAGTAQEWDAYANKAVLVDAINGRMAISYAGLGHVKAVPADQWLVNTITGEQPGPPARAGAGPPIRFGSPLGLTVGGVCTAVQRAIETDFLAEPWACRKPGIEILITGWTWKRRTRFGFGRPRTFGVAITHSGRFREPCKKRDLPSRWHEDPAPPTRGWTYCTIGAAHQPVREQAGRLQAWLSRPGQTATADDIQAFIAAEIRHAAAHPDGDVIGTELMSLLLPANAPPRIRFLRDVNRSQPAAAFSPAFLSTNGMIAPAMRITGSGFSYTTDLAGPTQRITIQCIPPLPDTTQHTASSQPRRPAP